MGISFPGNPGIVIGRNKNMAWGITVPIVDSSDIWIEVINEDNTQYKVDGEWRDLIKIVEPIKVKGQDEI